MGKNTKQITLCGSTKFKREFEVINRQLSLEGNVVYSVSFFAHADNVMLTSEQKATLDEVHKRKIDNSDGILVINVDGYIGESTRSEIHYARRKGKFITYLSDFPDLVTLCDLSTMSLDNLNNHGKNMNDDRYLKALRAIKARIDGDFDNDDLLKFDALHSDLVESISSIVNTTLS